MPARPRARVVAAALVLGATWVLAGVLWARVPDGDPDPDVEDMLRSKKYHHRLEQIGGKAAVLGAQVTEGLEAFWDGRGKALAVALLGTAAAAGLFPWRPGGRPGREPEA